MGQGHILDANTLALWRFDDELADTRGAFTDSAAVAWTTPEGVPGITDYSPIAGQYARVFRASTTTTHQGTCFARATSVADRNAWIGSWTVEAFVRVDALPAASFDPLFGHMDPGGADATEANNYLALIHYGSDGKLKVFWEHGAGVNDDSPQVNGIGIPAATWCHVAISKNTATKQIKFYVNGALQDTVAYVNEPTGGSNGAWRVASDSSAAANNLGRRSNITIREIHFSNAVRGDVFIAANAARMATHGTHVTDASTYVRLDFNNPPTALDSSSNGFHLISNGAAASNVTAPGGDGVGLIGDGGRARSVFAAVLQTYFDTRIRNALIADFTLEMWIVRGLHPLGTDVNRRWGVFCHGEPGVETQDDNYIAAHVGPENFILVDVESGAGVNDNTAAPNGTSSLARVEHIAIRKTMTGATWTAAIFLQGVKVHEEAGLTNYDGGTNPETCGFQLLNGAQAIGSSNGRHVCIIDDTRLSNVARSDAEILESFERGLFVGATAEGYADGYAAGFTDGINSIQAPTISVVSPTPSTVAGDPGGFPSDFETARTTPIVLDIDAPSGISLAVVTARYKGETTVERCVYRRGSFRRGFAAGSWSEVIGDVLRLHVVPDDGWPSSNVLDDVSFDIDATGGGAAYLSNIGASS
jgi:hypothetical protein